MTSTPSNDYDEDLQENSTLTTTEANPDQPKEQPKEQPNGSANEEKQTNGAGNVSAPMHAIQPLTR